MSRVANSQIDLPNGVDVTINHHKISVKGPKGTLSHDAVSSVKVVKNDKVITVEYDVNNADANMHAGTVRALVNNMVIGVSTGFERKLELVGVGYRAKAQGKALNLTLGFSHPVDYAIPEGITIDTPTQTEIIIKGIDKQKVGQVASEIRAYRPPEPYKGKGIRYSDENVIRKEAKNK